MGSSSCNSPSGLSITQRFAEHTSYRVGAKWAGSQCGVEVVALRQGAGGAYGVLELTSNATGQTARIGLVILASYSKGEFYWKTMTEEEGPMNAAMPLAMFKKLSPLDTVATVTGYYPRHAQSWRDRVLAYHAKKARTASIVAGSVLEFKEPLLFGANQTPVVRFKLIGTRGRSKVYEAEPLNGQGTFNCRISKHAMENREYQVFP